MLWSSSPSLPASQTLGSKQAPSGFQVNSGFEPTAGRVVSYTTEQHATACATAACLLSLFARGCMCMHEREPSSASW